MAFHPALSFSVLWSLITKGRCYVAKVSTGESSAALPRASLVKHVDWHLTEVLAAIFLLGPPPIELILWVELRIGAECRIEIKTCWTKSNRCAARSKIVELFFHYPAGRDIEYSSWLIGNCPSEDKFWRPLSRLPFKTFQQIMWSNRESCLLSL